MDLRRILLNLKIARRSLVQFKWRTALAVLGVFFGTFSLIIVSNLSGKGDIIADGPADDDIVADITLEN